jgi:hypothetical protein
MSGRGRARANRFVAWCAVVAAGLALLASFAGCGHAHTTDAGKSENPSKQGTAAGGEGDGAGNGATNARSERPSTERKEHVDADRGDQAQGGGVPVASSAEGLLRPGAEEKIRDKLAAGGFIDRDGGNMRAGLLRFQREHDLPATGTPDVATLRKLGLDPGALLRNSSDSAR